MSEVTLWFERKFDFSFPVEIYPNLRMRLRGTPARIEELVQGLSREQLTHQPDGKWSIQENVGHLVDLEPLWLARVQDYLAGNPTLTAADLTNRQTDEARHNDHPLADILAGFRRARGELLARLEGLHLEQFARTALHPRLQLTLRLVDHLYFVAEHDDHHLARIWELRRLARR